MATLDVGDEMPTSEAGREWTQALSEWLRAGNDANATIALISPASPAFIELDAPALWSCCEVHDEVSIRMLVAANADLSLADSRGIPPLSACCMYDGSPSCVRLMLEAKAAVDQIHSNSKATPLMVAAHDGNAECVRCLLAAGALVDHQQVDGMSPLHSSCETGYPECIEVLLAHRADANLKSAEGFTPLILASQNGHAGCLAQVLQVSSADTRDAPNRAGANAIVMACQNGHLRCMLLLLQAGCATHLPADLTQTHGEAAIVCAMLSSVTMAGHSALLYALLAHGLHPDTGGSTAMKLALDHGHLECVQLLSAMGASRTLMQNGHKWLAWEIAEECGHPAIVEWLHASQQWTPLHHLEVLPCAHVRRLLLAGASLHTKRGNPPCTPLQRATLLGGGGMPQALLLLQAAEPWSANTHHLFPASSRRAAVELLLVGMRLRDRLLAESALGGASFCPDLWVQHVMPLIVSRAQCGQSGCYVQVTGLKSSPELNGVMSQLESEVDPAIITVDTRCGVHLAGQPKILAVRWRNLLCRCARCLDEGIRNAEGHSVQSGRGHMSAADMLLRVHDEQRHACRHKQGQQSPLLRLSDIAPVLLSDLMAKPAAMVEPV